MLKILLLSRYGSVGASSRLRTIQFIPFLKKHGFEVHLAPFFSDECLRSFYQTNRKNILDVTNSYYLRIKALLSAIKYDLVWVEKETFPWLPGIFESFLHKIGIPYVVDYDDALFHNYDKANSLILRLLFGRKLIPLIRNASAIVVGNSYLRKYMLNNSASKVFLVPTVVDLSKYAHKPELESGEFRVGWIGTPKTAKYLDIVSRPLRDLSKKYRIKMVTIGAPELNNFLVPVERHNWSETTEAEILSTINLGIMPLVDGPWEQGKCGYKLIQYMACGRSVIASPVGVNKEIVGKENGFLAKLDNSDWAERMEFLINNGEERKKMGENNRALIEKDYSLQSQLPRIIEIFQACLS